MRFGKGRRTTFKDFVTAKIREIAPFEVKSAPKDALARNPAKAQPLTWPTLAWAAQKTDEAARTEGAWTASILS
jgi:hypothetical protein